jgi:hypothetical protein
MKLHHINPYINLLPLIEVVHANGVLFTAPQM